MTDLLRLVNVLWNLGVEIWNLHNSGLEFEKGLEILEQILQLLREQKSLTKFAVVNKK